MTHLILCIIYVRVSSERQVREGNGLLSQEQRCRAYAKAKGYQVLAVFRDEGISGALLERPGIRQLLDCLQGHRGDGDVVVIVDDISRIARDVSTHIQLRAAIKACGGRLDSPSFRFEENAMGEMVETIFAAVAQYGRTGNREQVINRQRARLEAGFWVFPAPPAYAYAKHREHKKLLVPDPARAGVVREALVGYAIERFVSKRDIVAFLKRTGFYGAVGREHASKYEMAVHRILENRWFYAGFIEYAPWGISRRPGQHEPIIDASTACRIEERLRRRGADAPVHTNADERLALINYVRCATCGRPLTGSLAKGKYPCYHCYNQGNCLRYGHRIKQRALHADMHDLLQGLAAREETIGIIREVTGTLWEERLAEWRRGDGLASRRLEELDAQINRIVRRLSLTADDGLASEYERAVTRLRQERAHAESRQGDAAQPQPDYYAALERVGTLLRRPHAVWEKGSCTQKRALCRLVFAVPPAYDRETGFGTINLTVPYRVSRHYADPDSRMVDLTRDLLHPFINAVVAWSARLESVGL